MAEKQKKDLAVEKEASLVEAGANALVVGGAAAAASLATDPNPSHALAWAAGGVATAAWEYVKSKYFHWQEQRRTMLLEGFAGDQSAEEAAATFGHFADEPWAKNVIIETLRRCSDAVDDAVIPTLGRLLRRYVDAAKPIDWYFRGVSRVLCDLTATEFTDLRRLLRYLSHGRFPDGTRLLRVKMGQPDLVKAHGINASDEAIPSAPRLFRLLRANDLARAVGGDTDDQSMCIDTEIVKALAALISQVESTR